MQFAQNNIGQYNPTGYRVTANQQGVTRRVNGITLDWSLVPRATAGRNSIQTVTVTAVSGNITLTLGGQTATVAFNANADTIEAALEALSTIGNGNVRVSGTGPFTVEFVEDLRRQPIAALTGTGVTIAQTQTGVVDGPVAAAGGVSVPFGERWIPAGTILVRSGGAGTRYRPWQTGDTLVRGQCYIAERHFFDSLDLDQVGDVLDEGTVYAARIQMGGTGQPTEANVLAAFPAVRFLRD